MSEDSGVFYSKKVVICGYRTAQRQDPIQGCKKCAQFNRACHDHVNWQECEDPAVYYYSVMGRVAACCDGHKSFVGDFYNEESEHGNHKEITRDEYLVGSLIND